MGGLTKRVERALLGAMLSGGKLTDGFAYLRPGDFALERHRRVYAAITTEGQTWDRLSPGRREVVKLAVASRTSPRYLGELRSACPNPFHAPAYAALVLEARVCRAVSAYAAAFSVEASLLRGEIGRLGRVPRAGVHPAGRYVSQMKLIAAEMRSFSAWFNPDKTQAVPGPPVAPADGRPRDEEMILAALIQQRPEASQLMRMLRSTVFTDPLRQQVFLAIEGLHVAGQPIDELTVD
jgi:replicative DNA helicase